MKFVLKKYLKAFMLSGILIFFVAGCQNSSQGETQAIEEKMTIDKQVEKVVASMSLTEKIGQMVMVGVHGKEVNEDSLYILHRFHYGGIVLFDRNMESKEQVANFTRNLQEKSEERLPLFIAIDEEGGDVARMKDNLTPPPSQLEIGKTGDYSLARREAENISDELLKMGINLNFAPVADVGSLGTRHFSDDFREVSSYVESAVSGYESKNMLFSLKHFPGIGKGKSDSHKASVVVDFPLDTLEKEDIQPFKRIIDNHDNSNYFIMVSHIIYPQLDSTKTPASLSSKIITDLLKEKLGYKGIVITDDLEMGAVSKYYDYREVGVASIKAGADMVMMCHEYQHEEDMYMGILDAVKAGEISEERINESVRKIVKCKLLHLSK